MRSAQRLMAPPSPSSSPRLRLCARPAGRSQHPIRIIVTAPAEIISHVVWLYHVFSPSLRDSLATRSGTAFSINATTTDSAFHEACNRSGVWWQGRSDGRSGFGPTSPCRPLRHHAETVGIPGQPKPSVKLYTVAAAGNPFGVELSEEQLQRTGTPPENIRPRSSDDIAHELAAVTGTADNLLDCHPVGEKAADWGIVGFATEKPSY